MGECLQIVTLNKEVRKGLTEKVTFEERLETGERIVSPEGNVSQAEGTANAKALRCLQGGSKVGTGREMKAAEGPL